VVLHTFLLPGLQCSTGRRPATFLGPHLVLLESTGRLLLAFLPMLALQCLVRPELLLPPCHPKVLLQSPELT